MEALLDARPSPRFPSIGEDALQSFRKKFGPSAYVCRYLQYSRATNGFDSAKQRTAHEATHQRKFRCEHPSCAYFSSGFATRSALKKHNENYHPVIQSTESLASAVAALTLRNTPRYKRPQQKQHHLNSSSQNLVELDGADTYNKQKNLTTNSYAEDFAHNFHSGQQTENTDTQQQSQNSTPPNSSQKSLVLARNNLSKFKDCYCNGSNFGETIACDSKTCERKWFHLQCVGLKVTSPRYGEIFSYLASSSWFLRHIFHTPRDL
jgi:hypothetical protein